MNKSSATGSGERHAPEPRFLTVARVLKAWGLRGELKLQVLTTHPEELFQLSEVYLGEGFAPYTVDHFRWHRKNLLLKLQDCNDRTQADALRGQSVSVSLQAAPPLGPNEYYAHQLIGLKVVTLQGEDLGVLDEILETGANDVYVVHGPRGEVLLPARLEIIRQVDLELGVMTIYAMPGLLP